ncbi:MAG: Tm-1-like ATP-binding domain-containing protein [Pseudomonadota bacterium]
MSAGRVYVVGTFDTKGEELHYVANILRNKGLATITVDVSTVTPAEDVDIAAHDIAAMHPGGIDAVFETSDRGVAVTAMAQAVATYFDGRTDVLGMLALGGSGGTTITSAAMRALPVGVPRLIVSTVASGETSSYIGISDITMMYSVTDIAGLNRLSRKILANAANGLAGMVTSDDPPTSIEDHPAIGLTMFGVTTPGVQKLTAYLKADFDCHVFHANGPGGRAFEALITAKMLEAMVDVTTTEIADHLMGGVCTAGPARLDALASTGIPWIGSCGALDIVNFGPRASVPERYAERLLHVHNPSVTLMRTSPEENVLIGKWLASKLNASPGVVHLVLPEGGLSMLDAPGNPFWDPVANAALFDTLEANFNISDTHHLHRIPHHVNDDGFAHTMDTFTRQTLS